MNKQIHISARVLRFCRWSRARYAVFVSMSCAVSIGVLAVSVSDQSQLKLNTLVAADNHFVFGENEDKESADALPAEALILLLQENIIVNQNNDNAAARSQNYYIQI